MTKQAVVFVIKKHNQILMEKRSFSSAYSNLIVFPGGGLNPGETPEQALKRELKEELGITPKDFALLADSSYIGKSGVEVIPFLIKDWEGEIPKKVLDQGNPLVWIDIDELLNSPLPHVKEIVQTLKV